jgi:hypothetical protein
MKNIFILLIFASFFYSCDNATQPGSDDLRLILRADKVSGAAPLTVNFSVKLEGELSGVTARVPDYIFFSQHGKAVIPYSLPDTSRPAVLTWSSTEIYTSGQYKTVLLFQGFKNDQYFNLYSDTLIINVN